MGVLPAFFFSIENQEIKTIVLIERLTSLLGPLVAEMGLELVEIQYRREGAGWVLRLIIDKEAGVGIDDCAEVSREAGRLLEVEDLIDHAYNLEVSSPGLDRPLKKENDFIRFKGRRVKIKTREPVDNQKVFVGAIERMHNGLVTLSTEKGLVSLPFDEIVKARLVIDF